MPKWLKPFLVGAVAGVALLVAPQAHAATTLEVGGTNFVPVLGSLLTTLSSGPLLNGAFGLNTATVVPYPASLWPLTGLTSPTLGASVAEGEANLGQALSTTSGPVTVISFSQGTLVTDGVETELKSSDPNVTFVDVGDPDRGNGFFAVLFPFGTTIPVANFTVQNPVDEVNTDVVTVQYDGVADFPQRPWDLLATANAVAGMLLIHGHGGTANIAGAQVTSVPNGNGTTTTTYFVPTQTLPLVQPLVDLGVPSQITTPLNNALKPIVDDGYTRYDATDGMAGQPYLSHGQLVGLPKLKVSTPTMKAVPNMLAHPLSGHTKRGTK